MENLHGTGSFVNVWVLGGTQNQISTNKSYGTLGLKFLGSYHQQKILFDFGCKFQHFYYSS